MRLMDPQERSLGYYMKTYSVSDDFIEDGTIIASEKNLRIMLNDPKHAFGHGYCLAWCLNEDVTGSKISMNPWP